MLGLGLGSRPSPSPSQGAIAPRAVILAKALSGVFLIQPWRVRSSRKTASEASCAGVTGRTVAMLSCLGVGLRAGVGVGVRG